MDIVIENIFNKIILIFELLGVIAFAVSGAMNAIKKHIDLFGVIFIATTTALGGGVIRDVMLQKLPPSMFTNHIYISFAFATSLIVFFTAYIQNKKNISFHIDKIDFIINIFDAVGLGIFSILGVKIALSSGYSYSLIYCAFIGMLTGVGGGMLRDIMLMEVPYVLRKRVYAVASILGSVVYYLLYSFRVNDFIAISCGCIIIVAIRILAGHYNWNLPKI